MFQKDILYHLCILIHEMLPRYCCAVLFLLPINRITHENKYKVKNIIRVSFVQIKGIWDVE